MSTCSGRVLGAVAWVAVVGVGAVLVWVVISRAGVGLVSEAGPVTPSSTAPASEGPASTSPRPAQRGTWQGEVGVVTAACRAGDIALVGAQPEDGVVVHVLDQGPDQLVVAFRGDEEGPVTVVGRCQGGGPEFTVSSTAPDPTPPASGSPSGPADDPSGNEPGDDQGS